MTTQPMSSANAVATAEPIVVVENLTFGYPGQDVPILNGVNLEIRPGELVILAGPSGSGKSTLCRHLNGVIPHFSRGEIRTGSVTVAGRDIGTTPVHEMSTVVGMVQQSPESQLVCLKVDDELAFGPENLGLDHDEIVRRVDLATGWASLEQVIDGFTFECSGGQKQRIAVGSSLALLPQLMIMDEPTTDLDPVAAEEIVRQIVSIKETLGMTFVVVEHEFDALINVADRLVVLHDGVIIADGPPLEVLRHQYDHLASIGLRIPQHIVMSRYLTERAPDQFEFSISRSDVVNQVQAWDLPIGSLALPVEEVAAPIGALPSIEMVDVTYSYDGRRTIIDDVSFTIEPGSFVAVVGQNGSGKSTLARLLIGLMAEDQGAVRIKGRAPRTIKNVELSGIAGYLFQDPDLQLFNNTVREEVAFGMRLQGTEPAETERRIDETLELLRLSRYADRHPFSLSRGERQRLAMATVLVTDPDLIILDEPTTGQDRHNLDALLGLMQEWIVRKQSTVLMIAHDMELVATYADQMIVVQDGRVVRQGPTYEVLRRDAALLTDQHLIPPAVVEATRLQAAEVGMRPLMTLAEFYTAVSSLTPPPR